MVVLMSTFLLTLLGISAGFTPPCPISREIAPCTCRLHAPKLTTFIVSCDKMESFDNIVDVLRNRFPPDQDVYLKIAYSHLDDLAEKSFLELGMTLSQLNLNYVNLSFLNETSFAGLESVESLSLADNRLLEVPRKVLRKMPKLRTLDLGRSKITGLLNEDFQGLPTLWALVVVTNAISVIEPRALPSTMKQLHLGRNAISNLNGSLRGLTRLEWLFLNENQLSHLDSELPLECPRLYYINAASNQLQSLPKEIANYHYLDTVDFSNNYIQSVGGVFRKLGRLRRLHLTNNQIHTLADDEFSETDLMDEIHMSYNHLQFLNGAFSPLKKMRSLNLMHNHLEEFSLQEIRGLQNLRIVDLSNNRIKRLTGQKENIVELETRVVELHLEYNELTALEGALSGIHGLKKLSLHHNKLELIAKDDLIGLNDLIVLDISHNRLKTLEETSMAFLPSLHELIAHDNILTALETEFHGLPVLCKADLSNNIIINIGVELGSKSHCRGSGSLLIVALHGNPVLCESDFTKQADYMQGNFTLLQGDLSICPAPTTTTTTTTTEAPPTTTMSTTTLEPSTTEDISVLIRKPPPQVIPLLYSPDLLLPPPRKAIATLEKETSTTPQTIELKSNEASTNTEENIKSIIPPMIVLKDEGGQNVTLVIPMENGVLKKDHQVDHYIQVDENENENQSKRATKITNIEIVDMKPLPKDTPSHILPNEDQDRTYQMG